MDNINVNDLISSLSDDDIEMLKRTASSILGENASADRFESAPQNEKQKNDMTNIAGISSDDFAMIMKAKTIFERVNNASSKNADLINALKPHLSPESQQKADRAMRILRLFEILPYLKDLF